MWFEGLAQDAVAMNVDDLLCVAAEPVTFVDYVAYNTILIDRVQLLSALARGFTDCFEAMAGQRMRVLFGGGETADLHRRVWVGHGGNADDAFLRAPLSALGMQGDFDLATPWTFAYEP